MSNKVLIVDDEEDVLHSTEMLVELLGYEAIAVQDPGEVLEIAEREHPGIILQDLKMKDLNLAGFVASLRSNPATADIPLVFFSASGDLAHTAAKYDAWGYLSKPFTEKELGQVLERTIGKVGGDAEMKHPSTIKREVNAVFHDYWNLLSALNSYVHVLTKEHDVPDDAKRAVRGLEEVVLKLESKTDRLRSYIMALIEPQKPV